MTFEHFVAQRLFARQGRHFSATLVPIAITAIALSVLVMVMSVSILRGFQREIREKAIGFGAHITIQNYELRDDYSENPLSIRRADIGRVRDMAQVAHVQGVASKGGMIKTQNEIYGILFKGIEGGYDTTFLHDHLVAGRCPQYAPLSDNSAPPSNEVLVSQTIADKLQLTLGDKVRAYFWQEDNYRARVFHIAGIYNSDLAEFDEHYIIGDLSQLQHINGWRRDEVGAVEVTLRHLVNQNELSQAVQEVQEVVSYDLSAQTIADHNPALFSWLELLDTNIILILIVMTVVCIVSVVSVFLIMVYEKTSAIGILKTLGASNGSIRSIFLRKSARLTLEGILLGDGVALVLGVLQYRYHIVQLDRASYSMTFVPIDLNPAIFTLITLSTLVVCLVALLVPTLHITHISPAQSVKVD